MTRCVTKKMEVRSVFELLVARRGRDFQPSPVWAKFPNKRNEDAMTISWPQLARELIQASAVAIWNRTSRISINDAEGGTRVSDRPAAALRCAPTLQNGMPVQGKLLITEGCADVRAIVIGATGARDPTMRPLPQYFQMADYPPKR
jgi:hypothetical protein